MSRLLLCISVQMMRQKQFQVTHRRTRLKRTENLFPKVSPHSSGVSHSFPIIFRFRLLFAAVVSLGAWGREEQTVLIHSLQGPSATFLIFLPLLFRNGREERTIQSVSPRFRQMADQVYFQTPKHWIPLFVFQPSSFPTI